MLGGNDGWTVSSGGATAQMTLVPKKSLGDAIADPEVVSRQSQRGGEVVPAWHQDSQGGNVGVARGV